MSAWPHAPAHCFSAAGTYFITGATLHKQHFYRSESPLDALQDLLFSSIAHHECALQAWALFSNHYHLVVQSNHGESIRTMLSKFHSEAARSVNAQDGVRGRKVWFQFWDVQLTYEQSWLARLRYTHQNAVHHGVVREATEYHWCSAAWFERTAKASLVETVRRLRIDRVNVYDDFRPVPR